MIGTNENKFTLTVGDSTVQVSRSDNVAKVFAKLLGQEHVRLVATDMSMSDVVDEVFKTYNVVKSTYKQTKWHYIPVRFNKNMTLAFSRNLNPAQGKAWLLVDKHDIRLNVVGMRQAPLSEVTQKCLAIATDYVNRYNAVADGNVFNVLVRHNGQELLYEDVIAPTSQQLAEYIIERTAFIEREFDDVIAAIGKLNYSVIPHTTPIAVSLQ